VKNELRYWINFFGYSQLNGDAENQIAAFEYQDTTLEDRANFKYFLEINEEQKRWALEKRDEIDKKTLDLH
jgi:hypothetical protein